jgi:multimeric flavodoxin WrbA
LEREVSVTNALLISASPREGGNSDTAALAIREVLQRTIDTEFIRVADYDIRHCMGCGTCWGLHRCVIEDDDLDKLLGKCRSADVLVICSPVYWLNPPGIMKDFVDRTLSLGAGTSPVFDGKKVALATVAAENGFELHNELLSRWVKRFGAQVIATIDLYAGGKGDLAADGAQMEELEAFALRVARSA